ncbi:MAG: NFACT family protein [Clostridia bacterium]|nr:NFACT family protein [Clostridia bacterium]
MAFDSGFFAASVGEISRFAGARAEKIYQPRADEIVIVLRGREVSGRLSLRCGAGDARIALTSQTCENPAVPPNFCMLLRKHIQGSLFESVKVPGFERVAVFVFSGRDAMGFDAERRLCAEITGRNSNLILTDGGEPPKILGAMRPVDFSTSRVRQVLPGMIYELPPAQEGKKDPTAETRAGFLAALSSADPKGRAADFVASAYFGISPAVARQIAFNASGDASAECSVFSASPDRLADAFFSVTERIKAGDFSFNIAMERGNGRSRPVEYSFIPLTQYGTDNLVYFDTAGELIDRYYGEKDRASLVGSKAADLKKTVSTNISRLRRKLDIQAGELAECEGAGRYRADADLIIGNIYAIKKGDRQAELTDWSEPSPDGGFATRRIKLDPLLSPSENAAKLYKKYAKLKKAKEELTKQTAIAREELDYLQTVRDSLSRAENESDIAGIREELISAGYIRGEKGQERKKAPGRKISFAEYETRGGFRVLCGRNNLQNEEISFRRSEPGDIWFHAKGVPGSHVLLKTGGGEVPDADMTDAAEIAAYNSDAGNGGGVSVDYTDVKNLKKPGGARPGFVTYRTYRTAFVTPDPEKIAAMKKERGR